MTTATISSHRHPLKLVHLEGSYTCNFCKEKSFGQRYSCTEKDCNFHVHKVCKDLPSEIKHVFFEGNIFVFVDSKYDQNCFCDACGRNIEGPSYHSSCVTTDERIGRCSFYGTYWRCPGHDLHPYCAQTLAPKEEISEDGVQVFLKKKSSSNCSLCGHENPRDEEKKPIKSWCYVSEGKKYHIYCLKNQLIRKWEKMTSRDEWALIRSNIQDRRRSSTSTVMRQIKFVLSLIVSVLLGNPTPVLIDIASDIASDIALSLLDN